MSSDSSKDATGRPDPSFITRAASDAFSVRKVFGEAYERDGTLVIPVAKVWGGSGTGYGYGVGALDGSTGSSADDTGQGEGPGEGAGGGGGFGVHVRPVGVYAVGPDGTRWHPALDLNRVILGGQVVAMVVALVGGWVLGRRRR
ncbi:spore germination protein GerW family protein [Oerskovia paurometabola]|uniref:spore germination protein GerW family protein n=1 Tax=Oerskovia paurometabola TaxID=162170 RepID=UPI00381FD031